MRTLHTPDSERCDYEVDNSPYDNRCLRRGGRLSGLCPQHFKIVSSLIREVATGNVTWNKRSYRLWSSETEYTLVTRPMKWLVKEGFVTKHMANGFGYIERGYCELASKGRAVLEIEHESEGK